MDLFDPLPPPVAAVAGVALLATLRYRYCERRGRASWAAIHVPGVPTAPYRATSFTALERAPVRVRVEAFAIIAVGAVWPLAFLDALVCCMQERGARWVFDALVVLGCSKLWARGGTGLLAPRQRSLTLVAAGALLLASFVSLSLFTPSGVAKAQRDTTRVSAKALRDVAILFRAEHPNEPCPTAEVLRDRGYIDAASKLTDSWDWPFFIDCPGDDVRVSSAGRDKKLGSPDDVVEPIAKRKD
jgi:hypothetical protein